MAVQAAALEVVIDPADDGSSTIIVSGEVDLATGPALEEALAGVIADRPTHVVADLSEVEFADSTCVHLLVRARSQAIEAGVGFRVVAPEGSAGAVFALCGAEHLLEPVPAQPEPRFLNEWSH